jgi:hypothetical protein
VCGHKVQLVADFFWQNKFNIQCNLLLENSGSEQIVDMGDDEQQRHHPRLVV